MAALDHPYIIGFIMIAGFIIWVCVKVNEDDQDKEA